MTSLMIEEYGDDAEGLERIHTTWADDEPRHGHNSESVFLAIALPLPTTFILANIRFGAVNETAFPPDGINQMVFQYERRFFHSLLEQSCNIGHYRANRKKCWRMRSKW